MKTKMGPMAKKEELYFYLCISPWIIGFLIFIAGPIFASLFFSFCNYDVVTSPDWVGIQNYKRLFSGSTILAIIESYLLLFSCKRPLGNSTLSNYSYSPESKYKRISLV